MKFDSIKSQFLIFLSVCLLGMMLLVSSQFYFTNKLIELHQENSLLAKLSNDLLQMRSLEKEFMLRKNLESVKQFQTTGADFRKQLHTLTTVYLQYQLEAGDIDAVGQNFDRYTNLFLQMVQLQQKLGLDENSGEQALFRDAVQKLEQEISSEQYQDIQIYLLQLRRNEKNYMIRGDESYVNRQVDIYQTLVNELDAKEALQETLLFTLLEEYQKGFLELVDLYSQMGVTANDGLQGNFRKQAELVDRQLNFISSTLSPVLQQEEQRVKSTGLAIMTITSIALILIILRSFNVFQRAFTTFVMFFHRSKRELMPLDTKQMGFAEFKGLAQVANEMVEARQVMETKLNKTLEQLEQLNDSLEMRGDTGIKSITNVNHELESSDNEVVTTLGSISENRSRERNNHVKRVAEYSRLLALKAGVDEADADLLKQASPLHDIGKIAIPEEILNKPGQLTPQEMNTMQDHARIGYEMLSHSDRPLFKTASIIAYEHHEKWDGSGYPRGLTGSEIHLYGRITLLADVFDSLGSTLCYKKPWKDQQIFSFLQEQSGKMFDPELVELFFANLEEFQTIRTQFNDRQ